MQRTSQLLIDEYIQSCKARDEKRYYFRDELYDEDIRNTYFNNGIQNLAKIFLFNPKKIDKEMQRFKDETLGARDMLYKIAEELAANPKLCRKNILYSIYFIFSRKGKVPDCCTPLENLNLAQALCCGLDAYMQNYRPWMPSYQLCNNAIYFFARKNLAKCWQQFCGILQIIDDMSTSPMTVRFGWNSDTDTINEYNWQLLCRIAANARIKLSIDGIKKLSDSSCIFSDNKLKTLAKATAIIQKLPTLREASAYALLFNANTKLQRNMTNDKFFVDTGTTDKCVTKECTKDAFEFLEQTRAQVLARITIRK